MPEEANPAPQNEDTPTQVVEEAPAEDTPPTPVIDWEKRYNDLRPTFDQTAAERRQLEEEVERLRAAQQAQPAADPDYDEDDDYADPVARQQIARLEAQLAAQAQKDAQREQQETLQRQQQQEYNHIDAELSSIEDEFDEELSDEEARMLGNYALANRDEHGRPDVRLAYQTFNTVFEGRKAKWVDKKKSAPATPAAGPGAVEVADLSTPRGRIAYMDEQARLAAAQQ